MTHQPGVYVPLRALFLVQKRFPDAVNTQGRLYIASRLNITSIACTRSHIATTMQIIIIIPKIRKNCPLKSSYVAPSVRVTNYLKS